MEYAYVRVSSNSQNIERQLEELKKYNLKKENIFIDYQSGKDFERKNYKNLKSILKKDDLLMIKSIDRLGRNYEMILEEWKQLTKEKKVNILVLDMPILDTRKDKDNLLGVFVSDIVLQILSFVAQNERENIKKRQSEGIKIAKEKGIQFGRPPYIPNEKYYTTILNYAKREITIDEAIKKLAISKTTFFKYSKQIFKRKSL